MRILLAIVLLWSAAARADSLASLVDISLWNARRQAALATLATAFSGLDSSGGYMRTHGFPGLGSASQTFPVLPALGSATLSYDAVTNTLDEATPYWSVAVTSSGGSYRQVGALTVRADAAFTLQGRASSLQTLAEKAGGLIELGQTANWPTTFSGNFIRCGFATTNDAANGLTCDLVNVSRSAYFDASPYGKPGQAIRFTLTGTNVYHWHARITYTPMNPLTPGADLQTDTRGFWAVADLGTATNAPAGYSLGLGETVWGLEEPVEYMVTAANPWSDGVISVCPLFAPYYYTGGTTNTERVGTMRCGFAARQYPLASVLGYDADTVGVLGNWVESGVGTDPQRPARVPIYTQFTNTVATNKDLAPFAVAPSLEYKLSGPPGFHLWWLNELGATRRNDANWKTNYTNTFGCWNAAGDYTRFWPSNTTVLRAYSNNVQSACMVPVFSQSRAYAGWRYAAQLLTTNGWTNFVNFSLRSKVGVTDETNTVTAVSVITSTLDAWRGTGFAGTNFFNLSTNRFYRYGIPHSGWPEADTFSIEALAAAVGTSNSNEPVQ